MKKIIFIIMIVALLLNLSLINAVTQQEINEAKSLINSKVECKSLSDSQLEIIGEYYMEQMHPGEAHELMHKMMGMEEGSEVEKQFHINMAKTIYCSDGGMMNSGMMNMMSGNMMGGQNLQGGMMGNYNYQNNSYGFQIFFYVILTLVIVVLILLVILLINKSKKSAKQKRRKTK